MLKRAFKERSRAGINTDHIFLILDRSSTVVYPYYIIMSSNSYRCTVYSSGVVLRNQISNQLRGFKIRHHQGIFNVHSFGGNKHLYKDLGIPLLSINYISNYQAWYFWNLNFIFFLLPICLYFDLTK